jgi:hypothetical protein
LSFYKYKQGGISFTVGARHVEPEAAGTPGRGGHRV